MDQTKPTQNQSPKNGLNPLVRKRTSFVKTFKEDELNRVNSSHLINDVFDNTNFDYDNQSHHSINSQKNDNQRMNTIDLKINSDIANQVDGYITPIKQDQVQELLFPQPMQEKDKYQMHKDRLYSFGDNIIPYSIK